MCGTLAIARAGVGFPETEYVGCDTATSCKHAGFRVFGQGMLLGKEWGMERKPHIERVRPGPMGVEERAALGPVPRRSAVQPPKRRAEFWASSSSPSGADFPLGVWHIGWKLYIQANAPVAQVTTRRDSQTEARHARARKGSPSSPLRPWKRPRLRKAGNSKASPRRTNSPRACVTRRAA